MSLGFFWEAAASAATAGGISLVSILQEGDLAKVLHQLDTIFLPTLLLWIGTRSLYSVVCWASVRRSFLGKSTIDLYSVWHMLGHWAVAVLSK